MVVIEEVVVVVEEVVVVVEEVVVVVVVVVLVGVLVFFVESFVRLRLVNGSFSVMMIALMVVMMTAECQ